MAQITDKEQKAFNKVEHFIKKQYPQLFQYMTIDVVVHSEMKPYIALIMSDKSKKHLFLELSRKALSLKDYELIGLILHELGHLEAKNGRILRDKDAWKSEKAAEVWALREASRLKLPKVFSYLFFEFLLWGQNFVKKVVCKPQEMDKYVYASYSFVQDLNTWMPQITLKEWKK
jgi:hypothetical protein